MCSKVNWIVEYKFINLLMGASLLALAKFIYYYDLLGAFDMHDTMKNGRFIDKYFKIV